MLRNRATADLQMGVREPGTAGWAVELQGEAGAATLPTSETASQVAEPVAD